MDKPEERKIGYAKYQHKLGRRITVLIVVLICFVGLVAIFGSVFYRINNILQLSTNVAQLTSARAALCIDGDKIEQQFAEGVESDGYAESEQKLYHVLNTSPDKIKYIYVYIIKADGIYCVYDLDIPGEEAYPLGMLITNDLDIESRIDEFLVGGDVEPGRKNEELGQAISAYTPVYNSAGKTVAYACADIDYNAYFQEVITSIILYSVLLVIIIIAASLFIIWYIRRHITTPIQVIEAQTRALKDINPEDWLTSEVWKTRTPVHTGDELEELYLILCSTRENISVNVRARLEAEQQLLQTKELERINKELEKAIQKADEASKGKADFYSRMSHDMRTPMNGILGISELSRNETDVAVLQDNISKIHSSGQYLLGLINDTLDLQRIESGKLTLNPQPTLPKELIATTVGMISQTAKSKDVKFEIKTGNANMNNYILVDPLRMRQIFVNLISNAIKFTPSGGTVELEYKVLKRESNKVYDAITVTDTGVGMSRDFIANKIFKPFSQEHNQLTDTMPGSGLGLSIVKRLVEMMGGTINVESELGTGTKFTVYLEFEIVEPTGAKADQAAETTSREALMKELNGKHILLAEDHPLNAEIAKKLLEKVGCMVAWVKDGQECVDTFKAAKPNQYDAILMDIRMPVMDGLTATRAIRALDKEDAKNIPIIAMTANAYAEDVQLTLDALGCWHERTLSKAN